MNSHDTEKPLTSPKELEPGGWCEYCPGSQRVYLHPVKDELFVINYSGQLGRWRYTPKLTFVDGFESADIQDLVFSPDGKWFAIMVQSLSRIELRSTADLSCLHQFKNEFIHEAAFDMCLSQDGRWLVVDTYKYYGEADEAEGIAWIDLETEDSFAVRGGK
jgi:hypothetical protein